LKTFLKSRGVLFTFGLGGIVMLVVLFGTHKFFNYTNTLEFCISCHEMEDTVYKEYQKSLHYNNRTGVRAECPDCHVPEEQPEKLYAKINAVKDIYHHLLGTIDTVEKFEANRLAMAEKVWAKMEASGSRECRSCHSFEAMILEEQGRRGRKKHPKGIEEGKTCIDCHKGIVHKLPKGYNP